MQFFYLPCSLAYDISDTFRGHTMLESKDSELATHAQRGNLHQLIQSIEGIELETEILSLAGIRINDMKLHHILYNSKKEQLGIIDCGIYQKSSSKDLWIQNLKEMNYYLRQALLWANYEGTTHEITGIDFPEIYDELDAGTMRFSEVLKEEIPKYKVKILEELKHCYQKEIFY